MTNKIPDRPGPVATPQGWFTWNYWGSLFVSFFSYLESFVWTPRDPIQANPFPQVITLSSVQEWLKAIHFETNLKLAEQEIDKEPTDSTTKTIETLQRAALLTREKIPQTPNCKDWTPVTNLLERVDDLASSVIKSPSYLPIVSGTPSLETTRETFGLGNPHNDCFMNACLQMIFSSPFLVKHIVYGKGQNVLVQQVYTKWRDHYEKGTLNGPKLANVLRSLNPDFKGFGQHDANEFLMALTEPLIKEGNPLFFNREEHTLYEGACPEMLVEESLFRNSYKVKIEAACTVQLVLRTDAIFPLISDLVRKTYTSSEVEGEVSFLTKEGESVKYPMKERKFSIDPPSFLFVDLVRHQVASQGFRDRGQFVGRKNGTKVSFQKFFYIPPEQTLDGKGAKYEWISYAVQGGDINGGHYTANIKHENGFHHYSDSLKSPRTEEAFLREGQSFYLGFAKRVECENVAQEMLQAEEKGEIDQAIGKASLVKDEEQRIVSLIQLFNKYLDEEPPNLHKLQKVYDALDDRFREFVSEVLGKHPRERLIELKSLVHLKLGIDLSGNIVAQYETIRCQNIMISRDLKKDQERAEAEKNRLEHLDTITEEQTRLKVAKILDPGLEKILQVKSIQDLLDENAKKLAVLSADILNEQIRNGA